MRRILAITLLIAFGSSLVLPLFAAQVDSQRNLPACCRRNGAHHCNGLLSANSGPAFQSPPCPNYPSPATPVSLNTAALAAPITSAIELAITSALPATNQARALISILSSNQLRGPPTLLA